MSTNNYNLGQRLQAHDSSCILTFMSISLLSNVIIAQVGRHISRSRRVTSRLRRLRFSRGWCCDSHRFFRSSIQVDWNVNVCWKHIVMLVPLESDSSDDDCVAHHRVASSPRTIVAEPLCASSLYHDDSCLSPRYVHLVSKVAGRPLGDVYQTLSFVAAYFHTVPSLHLGNVTTVDPAMMVQPERSFEAFAPSVSQLDCSRCVCCSIWRVRQMPTSRQRRVDSSTHSAQRDLSQQFAMDVLARQMVSSVPLDFVSLWNICHTCQPSLRSVCLDPATKQIVSHVICIS